LIENTSLPDDYILDKIVGMSKRPQETADPGNDRVFIVPTL
jgi:CDP-diacylglycerol---glycerol-3-phosphate 3-phosphatidyltransferase